MLIGLHVPTNFQMYRQNSKKAWGAIAPCPPPPPPPSGYATDSDQELISDSFLAHSVKTSYIMFMIIDLPKSDAREISDAREAP